MAREKRKWSSEFSAYMEKIVSHPTYSGMPEPRKKDGSIQWICAGKSPLGHAREAWWDVQRKQKGIAKAPGWKAATARAIHPFGRKPCQICGTVLSLDYVYPNKNYPGKAAPLDEIHDHSCPAYGAERRCSHLGPGAMSNCPDRFDGFHSYNRCCRSKEDTGRHADNLERYGEDRRAYEFWSDGDWKAANWLQKVFQSHSISADHIGPISLGFCHRPKFHPMTTRQNSSKGNRLTHRDVLSLIADEQRGESVISEHSKNIWNRFKERINNDQQAKELSRLMRKNMHLVLTLFS